MVQDAKHVAINPADTAAVSRWRESNKAVAAHTKTPFVCFTMTTICFVVAFECCR